MPRLPNHLNAVFVVIALLMGSTGGRARAQAAFETAEAQTALKAALGQIKELEAKLDRERQAGEAMAARAAAAGVEAKSLGDELEKLRVQSEALGPGLGDGRALDRRLLDAVNDLRLAHEENRKLSESLVRLSEAVMNYLRAPADQQTAARKAVESVLADAAGRQHGGSSEESAPASRIESSQVVSAQPAQKLVVINAGEKAGLKIGTPIRFYRNDRPVASALIVDVRERISGALVTNTPLPEDFPKVGDSLRIDTSKH
jgi:hypothetical protein